VDKIKELELLKYHANKIGHTGISDRIDSIVNLFNEYDITDESERSYNPLYIVWSIAHTDIKSLKYKLGQFVQNAQTIAPDFIHFVCDKSIKRDVYSIVDSLVEEYGVKFTWYLTGVDRKFKGNSNILNWEIGLYSDLVNEDRVLFLNDSILFFDVNALLNYARIANLNYITNFSTIMGQHLAYKILDWSWGVHSKWAPTPVLNAWVSSRAKLKEIGGFDIRFRLGSGYMGELDLLLRWVLNKDYISYKIEDSVSVLRTPQLITTLEQKQIVDLQVSQLFPIFRDKYGEINPFMQVPFRLDTPLIRVTEAMTDHPFSVIEWESKFIENIQKLGNQLIDNKRYIYDFHKPNLNLFME